MKSDRLLSIIILLTERTIISASTLAEIFEVSTRTIYRDIDTLTMAGVPIYTTPGKNGGISILDSYKLDKHLLNSDDITSLLMGLDSIENIFPNKSILGIQLKIKNLIDKNKENDIEQICQQIKIDHTPWNKDEKFRVVFEQIQSALKQKKLLQFSYKDRFGLVTQRKIEPYRLLLKSREWYLQGYCVDRKDFRTFRIQKISNINILSVAFVPRTFCLDKLDNHQFIDKDIELVKLRVSDKIIDKFIARHGEQSIISHISNYHIIQIPLPLNQWGCNYVLGFGEHCECLEPLFFREQIKNHVFKLFELYNC